MYSEVILMEVQCILETVYDIKKLDLFSIVYC